MKTNIASHIGLPQSTVPGFSLPAIPHPYNCLILSVAHQMAIIETWHLDRLLNLQLEQLHGLLRYACQNVPFYKESLAQIAKIPLDRMRFGDLKDIPLLSRQEAQEHKDTMFAPAPPKSHGAVQPFSTSGSTGQPLLGKKTHLSLVVTLAAALRYHRWFNRDFDGSCLSIVPRVEKFHIEKSWAPTHITGDHFIVPMNRDPSGYIKLIRSHQPTYIQSVPNLLLEIIRQSERIGWKPTGLKEVRSYGENLTDEMRQVAQDVWGVPWRDLYSNEEIGTLAIECPHGGHYHVVAENAVIEILREDGSNCDPGEMGRVVLTGLQNFAQPFIRYETGDFAISAEQGTCSIPLPSVKQFIGRERNLLRLPSGERRHFPTYSKSLLKIADFPQYWIEQNEISILDFYTTLQEPLSPQQVGLLEEHFEHLFGHRFNVRVHIRGKAPRSATGKFDIFKSVL